MDFTSVSAFAAMALGAVLAFGAWAGQPEGAGVVHARGAPGAPVTPVEYTDFQCPFCLRVLPAVERSLDDQAGTIRWFVKQSALSIHQDAALAHDATPAAGARGRLVEMHDGNSGLAGTTTSERLLDNAGEPQVDAERLVATPRDRRHWEPVEQDIAAARRRGIRWAPIILVDGARIDGLPEDRPLDKPIERTSAAPRATGS